MRVLLDECLPERLKGELPSSFLSLEPLLPPLRQVLPLIVAGQVLRLRL